MAQAKLVLNQICVAMKLFRRRGNPAKQGVDTVMPSTPKSAAISLSAEQKSMLENPVDSRVDRILQEIYADRAEAERALKARRIIQFPHSDSGERLVVQDEDGFWRIVSGSPPETPTQLLDSL